MASPILSPTFHIGTIKIGSIEGASCFSIGNNFIEDFKNTKKHNQGFGNIHGDRNNFARTSSSLTKYDQDQPMQKAIQQKDNKNKQQTPS
jgi:hypothetical protein